MLSLIVIIITLTPHYAIMDSGTRGLYIASIVISSYIIILGFVGIILYFIAPDKLKKFVKWVVRLLPS